ASDLLEVDLFERRGQDADAVALPSGGDAVGDESRRVVSAGAGDRLDARVRLELDAARSRELRRRPGRDDLASEQDRHTVADELDLGEQVRVEENGDAAAAQLLEQQPHGA